MQSFAVLTLLIILNFKAKNNLFSTIKDIFSVTLHQIRTKIMPMVKNILTSLMLVGALTFAPAFLSEASARIELSDIETQQPVIRQFGSSLVISGAQGKTVYVYNLIGVQLLAIHVDSYEKRIDLGNLPRGIYPIRIGNYTKKIQL